MAGLRSTSVSGGKKKRRNDVADKSYSWNSCFVTRVEHLALQRPAFCDRRRLSAASLLCLSYGDSSSFVRRQMRLLHLWELCWGRLPQICFVSVSEDRRRNASASGS